MGMVRLLMRRGSIALLVFVLAAVMAPSGAQAPVGHYRIRQVPLSDVKLLDDGFWTERVGVNRDVTIPHIFRQNEKTGRVENFVKAATHRGAYEGRRFNDTDVYKAIEVPRSSGRLTR
jgi:uncharacterized protein